MADSISEPQQVGSPQNVAALVQHVVASTSSASSLVKIIPPEGWSLALAFSMSDKNSQLRHFALAHEGLIICSSICWLMVYASLLNKLRKERSAASLSFQTLFGLLFGEIGHFIVILCVSFYSNETYAPVSFLYFICQAAVCVVVSLTFTVAIRKFVYSYQDKLDIFGSMDLLFKNASSTTNSNSSSGLSESPPSTQSPSESKFKRKLAKAYVLIAGKGTSEERAMATLNVFKIHWCFLYLLAAVAALPVELIRQRRSLPVALSYLETFIDLVLALAIIPQLLMIYQARPKLISPAMGRFITGMMFARLASLIYWLTDPLFHTESILPGRGVRILTQFVNVAILCDVSYLHLIKSPTGKSSNLPL